MNLELPEKEKISKNRIKIYKKIELKWKKQEFYKISEKNFFV